MHTYEPVCVAPHRYHSISHCIVLWLQPHCSATSPVPEDRSYRTFETYFWSTYHVSGTGGNKTQSLLSRETSAWGELPLSKQEITTQQCAEYHDMGKCKVLWARN